MSVFETGWGNAVPDPMGAGAYGPGYGAWLADQTTRDWETYAAHHPWRVMIGLQAELAELRRLLAWYMEAHPDWHLARLIEPTRTRIDAVHRRIALVAAGAPNA